EESRLDEETFARTLFEWAYPRIAERCREAGAPYPRLGADGELLGPVPR
ncbi:MAG: RNA methyltransferase, partial [Gemmatimonadota bacterium]|nr:RNA methyltransferase [Gemmatimonadota bacterium]